MCHLESWFWFQSIGVPGSIAPEASGVLDTCDYSCACLYMGQALSCPLPHLDIDALAFELTHIIAVIAHMHGYVSKWVMFSTGHHLSMHMEL